MFRTVWHILTPRQRSLMIAAQLLSLLMAVSTVAGIASIGPFFAVLGDPHAIDHSALLHWVHVELGSPGPRSFAISLGVIFVALVLLANAINLTGSFVLNRLAWRIGNELQTSLYSEYLNRPYQFHGSVNRSTLINRVLQEVRRVSSDILQDGLVLVANAFTALLILISITLVNPVLALAMLAVLAGGYFTIFSIVRKRLSLWGGRRAHAAQEQIRIGMESFGAIREVTIFGARKFFEDRFARVSAALARASANVYPVAQCPKYVMESLAIMGLVGAALFLVARGGEVGSWLGQLTFLGYAAYRLMPAVQQVFGTMVKISAARAGLGVIAPDLRVAQARKQFAAAADPSWLGRPKQEIRLEELSFRYSDDGPLILDRVSLCIPAGTAIAFMGANGSGKTTAVDLIAGLLEPASGEIRIDGIRLDAGNRRAWQARIAYVPQEVLLLDTDLAQNIALGVPSASIDWTRLRSVARLTCLDEWIGSLPGGYRHRVGEHGGKLSGGQRQRIGIARALYKEASVLILDEATSALDSVAERELSETLVSLRGQYTVILISHRPSIARLCDAIVEFAGGAIVHASSTMRGVTAAFPDVVRHE